MLHIAPRLNRIKPSPSSMAGQRARELRATGRDILSLTAGLFDRLNTAPELEEDQRRLFDVAFRRAAEQLDALARTLDFADLAYWRAVKRAHEQ